MAINTDFEIQADKDIRYIGAAHGAAGAGYYTVIEFHRWLQDLADDAASAGDDYMDITRATPSDRSTDNIITLLNGYNIDDVAAEHLYDGSIIQTNGDVIYDGILIYANAGMDMQIIQNGAVIANDFWNTVPNGSSLKRLNANAANGISHRFMIKTRTAAADIDGRRLLCQTRVWGKTFSEFKINGTSRGNNVAALTYADDLNNTTAEGTVGGWTTITNVTEGYNGIDVNNDSTLEYYYSEWNKDTYSINQFYERMKYLSRQGSASTLYGLTGELFRGITHQFDYDTETNGPFSQGAEITWGTGATAGTGQLLALLDSGTTGTMWIQLKTGVIPTDNLTINQTGGKACSVNGSVIERTLSFPFCGVSTGSAIIGAFGFGVESTDLSATDKVFDLTNTQRTPPNYVTFTVGGLISGEDRVLVGPASGGVLLENQFTLASTYNTAGVTSIGVSTTIPTDTPTTGTIRVARNSGKYSRIQYTGYSGTTFIINSTDFSADPATSGNSVYISYIDLVASSTSASFTSVYSSDRQLFIRVRDGGASPIKTFETTGTLGSGGGSTTAIRTSDA